MSEEIDAVLAKGSQTPEPLGEPPLRPVYSVVALSKGAMSVEQFGRVIEQNLNHRAAMGFHLQWVEKEGYNFLGIMATAVPMAMPQLPEDEPKKIEVEDLGEVTDDVE